VTLPHAEGVIRLDGVLDEEIWSRARAVVIDVETSPRENMPAFVQTTAYLVENGAQLLIAFDARDPEPNSIRAYLRDRDSAFNDDFVGVVLDTFNDERRAYEFFANPLGVQMDLIQDDVNRNEDDSWDSIWESAGTITDEGFVVEMAIPFSQMRFPRTGEQIWGIDVLRFRPRTDRVRMSNNPLDRGRNCYLCQFQKFRGFAGAEPGRALEVVPTLTAVRTDERADPTAGGFTDGDFDEEVGVSVRWGITPDVTADLALNPDFSQVEADVAQLEENTQFALFYPESRPFFLEGADYFASMMQAVFTRTVADPDVGLKLTGRSDVNTFGVFATEDELTNLLFPGPLGSRTHLLEQTNETFVGRYTRGFGNSSTIGALVTRRSGDDYHNDVAGIDGRYRVNDQHSIRFQYLSSDTEYPSEVALQFGQPEDRFKGDAYRVDYSLGTREWDLDVSHRYLEAGFRADAGFVTRVDVEQQFLEFSRIWHGDSSERWWNQLRVGVNAGRTRDISGQLLGRYIEPIFAFQGPMQSFFQIGTGSRKEFWEGRVFDLRGSFLFGQFRPRSGLSISISTRVGDQLDYANAEVGDQVRWQPQIDWNVNRHFLVRLRHTSDELKSKSGPTVFDAALTDLRLTWQFNLRSFLRLTLQRQHVERNLALYRVQTTAPTTSTLASQLLYSYKLNPQTVFFAGYSDNHLEHDLTGRLERTDRTLFFKLGYAWAP
jgi:hypothetical protein